MVNVRARRRSGVLVTFMVGCLAAFLVAATGFGSARAATSTGEVYVINALAGTTADVVMDGKVIAAAAAPKTIVGPLALPSGTHVVSLKSGSTTVVTAQFTVRAGSSSDVVAHRTADAQPQQVVTVFPNDLASVAPGKVRLVVSHVAVAPPADIRQDGKALFRNVANGESLSLVVPAASGTVDIVPTATSGPAILAPVTLDLKAGTLTRVFAIGDASAGTTDAVVQVISVKTVGSKAPSKVQTGDGGQAADSFVGGGPGFGTLLAVTLALLVVAAAGAARGAAGAERVIGSRHSR